MIRLILLAILFISVSIKGESPEIELNNNISKNLRKNMVKSIDQTNLYINDGTPNEFFGGYG